MEAYRPTPGTIVRRRVGKRQPSAPRPRLTGPTRQRSRIAAAPHGEQREVDPEIVRYRAPPGPTAAFASSTSPTSLVEVLRRPLESTQYAAADYRRMLTAHGFTASMSRRGDCYDNAVAESLLLTLEFELLMWNDWHTREDARRAIFRYIEIWYNRRRRHSTLGYLNPAEYEAQVHEAA
jgi:putative transposase